MRCLLFLALLAACDDATTSEPGDAALDLGLDAAPDGAPPDASPDLPDLSADRGPDEGVDAELEVDAGPDAEVDAAWPPLPPFGLSELMARNDGAWTDEVGEVDDWIELHNRSDAPIQLSDYALSDKEDTPHPLPELELGPGELVVLFADNTPDQGPLHLPFKLSGSGESLYLWRAGQLIEQVEFDETEPNEAWARLPQGWSACRWATPAAENGARCGPPPPPEIPTEASFEPYEWSEPWPFPPQPLALSEIALRPAGFVEVFNTSEAPVQLADYALRLAPHAPGQAWPAREEGVLIEWPAEMLAPGAHLEVPVRAEQVAAVEATEHFEGVLSLWAEGRNFPVERVDFMSWPEGAALTRVPDGHGRHRFCAVQTPGAINETCEPLERRPVGERLRHLRTPGDFDALAEGGTAVGIDSVKFVMDLEAGGVVHLLATASWGLHYTFVRERIDLDPPLSRCDPEESRVFLTGWRAFSAANYTEVEGRRYLLGTLVHHGGAGLRTVEYTPGDRIIAPQMRQGFFGVAAHLHTPQRWSMRPQSGRQVEEMLTIDGEAPIVGPNAPFRGVTYQPLTATVGYGLLTFVPVEALESTALGPQVIVITDQVPNDIALTGGLITEAFQTPLAHVNLLSRNRNTPNMALVNAREDPRLAPLIGELVRLEVAGADFDVRRADPAEAEAFWASRRPEGEPLAPRLDESVRGLLSLREHGLEALPIVGAKAAQLGELVRVDSRREDCLGPVPVPRAPAGIAIVHSREHYAASGAAALLDELQADPEFRGDPRARAAGLARVRALIMEHPVDPELLAEVQGWMAEEHPETRLRFRSSSNTEDLPGFNGAGLYTSISAELGNESRSVQDALRTVWASLYLERGYAEREYHNISQEGVGMGVLVHPAFLSERMNGVGISRNILEPIRNQYYLNLQFGEATVTNPAPGVASDQLLYDFSRAPRLRWLGRSTLSRGEQVMSNEEIDELACTLRAIHDHFRPLIDPLREDRWFAMDIEFKRLGEGRFLVVKQARPYSFGAAEIPEDCREL